MKISSLAFLSILSVAVGFQIRTPSSPLSQTRLFSTSPSDVEAASTKLIKENLLSVASDLKDEYGLFLIDSKAKKSLKVAVEELEEATDPPSADAYNPEDLLGDWTLLCTTSTSKEGIDTSKLPFFNGGPLKSIRKSLNKCLTVVQRIRSIDNDFSEINRVDHVLDYKPPDSLKEVIDNLPEALTSLNTNPLQVSASKVILAHKAEVESGTKPLKTKLSLESVILNVAGTSQYLDPDGKDLIGLNIPLGEFLQAGAFETTYVDENLRISRGKIGLSDVLRVFVKSDTYDGYDVFDDEEFGGDNVFEDFEDDISKDE